MKDISFSAPWGAPLALMTAACTVICLLVPVPGVMIGLGDNTALRALGMSTIPTMLQWAGWLTAAVPLLVLLVSAAFMVRGYVLRDASLIIKRLGWERRLDLSKLNSATVDPEALRGSLRLFGNGGCFAFVGWFRNQKLGVYRAFATDSKRAVVLRFFDKTVVITPDDPQKFVAEINANISHEA
jgi:hypothetical protein